MGDDQVQTSPYRATGAFAVPVAQHCEEIVAIRGSESSIDLIQAKHHRPLAGLEYPLFNKLRHAPLRTLARVEEIVRVPFDIQIRCHGVCKVPEQREQAL